MPNAPGAPATLFKVFLFTDLVGSTEIKARIGDSAAADLIGQHDALFRETLSRHHGTVQSDTGDGFFAVFDRPTEALLFALSFVRDLSRIQKPARLHVRIGIHAGEIVHLQEEASADGESGPAKLVGLALDTTHRIMSLAQADQILMTHMAFDTARHHIGVAPDGSTVEWRAHGPYLFKGISEPIEVFEAGVEGIAPLTPPPDSEKVRSATAAGDEVTLGWRPASEADVPGRKGWKLDRLLGKGGFGEVWVAHNDTVKESRTFKFCFKPERVRSLKRELTLFRLMREVLGNRPDIAHIYEVKLDEAPYYLEMEYTAGGDLYDWTQGKGGLTQVPLQTRLGIMIEVAEAVAAAHSVGVIHKDIKPRNVLIEDHRNGTAHPRLTDFGIGQLMNRDQLVEAGITASGFLSTQSVPLTEIGSRTGTRLYMAPELLAGKVPSVQSDIYALGVMLFQMVCGDLLRPLSQGWERMIDDPLLRDDIASCVDGDPARRLASATDLARRLRDLPQRRARIVAEAQTAADAALARRRKRVLTSGLAVCSVLLLGAVGWGYRERRRAQTELELKNEALVQRERAGREAYISQIRLTQAYIDARSFPMANEMLWKTEESRRQVEWGLLLNQCNQAIYTLADQTDGRFSPDGKLLLTASPTSPPGIWNAADGTRIRGLGDKPGQLLDLGFSPDGQRAVTVNLDVPGAQIWEVVTGNLVFTLGAGTQGMISSGFSPDGASIFTASRDNAIRVWDSNTGKIKTTLPEPRRKLTFAIFSPDGAKIAGHYVSKEGETGEVTVWDAARSAQLYTLAGKFPVFSRDGRRLLTNEERTARITETDSGKLVSSFSTRDGLNLYGDFSPDGKRCINGSTDGVAYEWNVDDGTLLQTFRHGESVTRSQFSPQGDTILTGSFASGLAKLWDAGSGKELVSLPGHLNGMWTALFSPDGSRLLTGAIDRTVRIWDTRRGIAAAALIDVGEPIDGLKLSEDGSVASVLSMSSRCYLLDVRTAKPLAGLSSFNPMGTAGSKSSALSSDGKIVVAMLDPFSPLVFDTVTRTVRWLLLGHDGGISSVDLNRDGTRALTTSYDGTARIWDMQTGSELLTHREQGEPVFAGAFLPDGSRAVTFSESGKGTIWESTTGRDLINLEGSALRVSSVGFDPSGNRLAACSGKQVVIWDARDGSRRLTLSGQTGTARTVVFDPRFDRLVTTSHDGRCKIWEGETGEELASFRDPVNPYQGAVFEPGGRELLALSGTAGQLRRWSPAPWRSEDLPGDASSPWRDRYKAARESQWKPLRPEALGAPFPMTLAVTPETLGLRLRRLRAEVVANGTEKDYAGGLGIAKGPMSGAVAPMGLIEGDRISQLSGRVITDQKTALEALEAALLEVPKPTGDLRIEFRRGVRSFHGQFQLLMMQRHRRQVTLARSEAKAIFGELQRALREAGANVAEMSAPLAPARGNVPESPDEITGLVIPGLRGAVDEQRLLRLGIAPGMHTLKYNDTPINNVPALAAAFDTIVTSLDSPETRSITAEHQKGEYERVRLEIKIE